jgi:excisionase family DNA binding protein
MHAALPQPAIDVIEGTVFTPAQAGRLIQLFSPQGTESSITFLVGPRQERVELPEALYRVLSDALIILSRGDAIVIGSIHQLLTTTAAADLLGISRQYLIRLIERRELECEMVGRHRRLRLRDVLAYREQRASQRRGALDKLTALDEELGAYE